MEFIIFHLLYFQAPEPFFSPTVLLHFEDQQSKYYKILKNTFLFKMEEKIPSYRLSCSYIDE